MSTQQDGVTILGIYVADLAFRAGRMPAVGETILGSGFAMGPGGKGSNQAIAAARVGATTRFISRLGKDAFGDNARIMYTREGVITRIIESDTAPTGAAFIFVNEKTGDNAIIVVAGAAGEISVEDVDAARDAIEAARVFITQLEQPIPAAMRALEIAKRSGAITILNPAPAAPLDPEIFPLVDYLTPNESEASAIVGFHVGSVDDAERAGDALLKRGVGAALITLGEKGALFHDAEQSVLIPAFNVGPVIDTTGAGDAFNGGFAVALARGVAPLEAVRFGCAVAGISVTRAGTAPAMPTRAEVEAILARK